MNEDVINMDACVALADLVPRCGGKQLEIGYQDETKKSSDARWYAEAYFRGARVWCDEQESPQKACDGLAVKMLLGGKCDACHRKVSVRVEDGLMTTDRNGKGRYDCTWYRDGDAWVQGCTGKRRVTRDA